MKLLLPNEPAVVVQHPVTMRGYFRDGEKFQRLDHEIVRALQVGHGSWPGDERYSIYAHPDPLPDGRWFLVRLAHDERYVVERVFRGSEFRTNFAFLNELTRWISEHDSRAGYDVAAEVAKHNDRVEAERDRVFSDMTQDFADHYLHTALRKDGAHRHVVGL